MCSVLSEWKPDLRCLRVHCLVASSALPGCSQLDLVGSIFPSSTLTKLSEFILKENSISGTVPDEYSANAELSDIFLDTNQLSGTVPEMLVQLPSAKYVTFFGNRFSGTLPEFNIAGAEAYRTMKYMLLHK